MHFKILITSIKDASARFLTAESAEFTRSYTEKKALLSFALKSISLLILFIHTVLLCVLCAPPRRTLRSEAPLRLIASKT